MINPSINGWIDKFFVENKTILDRKYNSETDFYLSIRETGFIYGFIIDNNALHAELKQDEIAKIALLENLFSTFVFVSKSNDITEFKSKLFDYYLSLSIKNSLNLSTIIGSKLDSELEHFINNRVQINKDIVSRNFSHIITNALLFIDVLAFIHFLKHNNLPEKYFKKSEETITQLVSLALKSKNNLTENDKLLIKLFESSLRYSKFSDKTNLSINTIELNYFEEKLEKLYLLDIAVLAICQDEEILSEEINFVDLLGKKLSIENDFVSESISKTHAFIQKYKTEIPYFNYSNPVKHFYDKSSKSVEFLIKRNKKRLEKELLESKELMHLLAKSTKKDLDFDEKKKVKKQLLDICKSIPSLTIFLLPGGGLLLPILIKFIPQLLPSAFNENLDED